MREPSRDIGAKWRGGDDLGGCIRFAQSGLSELKNYLVFGKDMQLVTSPLVTKTRRD